MIQKKKNNIRFRRSNRVRARIVGSATRPRLSVFRSNKHMLVQLIDDAKGVTIASVHSKKIATGKTKSDKAAGVGVAIASAAKAVGVTTAVFDRRGYKYHGRVKSVAEEARKAGLVI